MRQQNPDGRLVTTTPTTSGTGPRRETPLCLNRVCGSATGSGPKPAAGASRRRRAPTDEIARPTKKRTRSRFPVGSVVAEAAEPHSALEVVTVADGLYTLRYKTDDAWRGHEITRAADDLVPFGASLPKRAKPVTTYRED